MGQVIFLVFIGEGKVLLTPRKKRLWAPSRRAFLRGLGTSIATPYVAKAQFSGPGFGNSGFLNAVPSASPPSYHAYAVHFDGATYAVNESLTATDNEFVGFVIWEKIALANMQQNLLWVSDPNEFGSYLDCAGVGDPLENVLDFGAVDGTGSTFAGVKSSVIDSLADQWCCWIGAMNTSTGARKLYNKDTDITADGYLEGAFNNAFNGRPFLFGGQEGNNIVTADLADCRFFGGIDLLTGGADIVLATRRLFVDADGKPVDPAVATAALGATGPVLFQRTTNAASFITNQGTGGAFTLTGTLTDAMTSPSD